MFRIEGEEYNLNITRIIKKVQLLVIKKITEPYEEKLQIHVKHLKSLILVGPKWLGQFRLQVINRGDSFCPPRPVGGIVDRASIHKILINYLNDRI